MTEQSVKGVQSIENRLTLGEWWLVVTHQTKNQKIVRNRGCTGGSGSDRVEPWRGTIESRENDDILPVTTTRYVRGQSVSYVGNIVGTKGEGRREPFSCSLKRGGPIGKVLVHRWLPECHQQK